MPFMEKFWEILYDVNAVTSFVENHANLIWKIWNATLYGTIKQPVQFRFSFNYNVYKYMPEIVVLILYMLSYYNDKIWVFLLHFQCLICSTIIFSLAECWYYYLPLSLILFHLFFAFHWLELNMSFLCWSFHIIVRYWWTWKG